MLIEAALTAGDAARARALVDPMDASPAGRLARTLVDILAADRQLEDTVADLDALIDELEPGQLRNQSIALRLLAAQDPAIAFDPSIADASAKSAGWFRRRARPCSGCRRLRRRAGRSRELRRPDGTDGTRSGC
jgi:hypothetical protein